MNHIHEPVAISMYKALLNENIVSFKVLMGEWSLIQKVIEEIIIKIEKFILPVLKVVIVT